MAQLGIELTQNLTKRLAGCRPLHPLELRQLQEKDRQNRTIDFAASEAERERQLNDIQAHSEKRRNSLLNRLWIQSFQKGANDDLQLQCSLLDEFFTEYLKTGEIPPPASAWRIAVILGKRKEKDLERDFLAAWVSHFGDTVGTMYEKLSARYRKLTT